MIQRSVDIKTVRAIGNWKHPEVVLEIGAEATVGAMRRAVAVISSALPPPPRRKPVMPHMNGFDSNAVPR